MNLKLAFSLLFVIFVLNNAVLAQANQNEILVQSPKNETYTFTQIGWLQPISMGNNFANKGIDFNRGLDFQFNFYYDWLNLFLGLRYQSFSGEVKNAALVGSYEKTTVNLYGIVLGYTFEMKNPRLTLDPRITLGSTFYRNKANFSQGDDMYSGYIIEGFKDTATTLLFSGTTNYKFSKHFGLYIQPEFRWDNMKINAPEELSSFFNSAFFVNISIGATIFL